MPRTDRTAPEALAARRVLSQSSLRLRVALGVVLAATAAAVAVPLVGDDAGTSAPDHRPGNVASANGAVRGTPGPPAGAPGQDEAANRGGQVKVLGDGSTSYTGPQPQQLKPERMKPGEKPPQFVVFSWDGALEGDDKLFSHFRKVAEESRAHMTFFLTGIYLLPESRKHLYRPPQHPVGDSAISYPTREHIRMTLEQLRKAWSEGDEIGSHFNGHFCGKKGGGDWSSAEWKSEIDQTYRFIKNWKTNTGFKDIPPLPFDPDREITGGRAPCLEGQKKLLPAIKPFGWRYDASSAGDFQIWPARKNGIWDFPLQLLPYPGGDFQALSMDFNFLYNQTGGATHGDPSRWATWRMQAKDAYLNGFERVFNGNRAPLFIGNHFENWNGGIYMHAVEDAMRDICPRKGVRCVSFRELADWLDVQDPGTLARLRNLDPAQEPVWRTLIR